ncbi:MAG: hypothetical protein O6942_06540 [Bacteroidetes bacterium]|nr:hypothetical protein [Bacteroidota bacterium]
MKLKFLLVFFFLLLEMGYMAVMVVKTDNPVVLEKIFQTPILGEWVYERRISEIRSKAQAGDVHEMMALYFEADALGNDTDNDLALKLLWNSGSAAAQVFLFEEAGGDIEKTQNKEFMLLVARAMRENVRPYLLKGDINQAYTQQSRRYAVAIKELEERAAKGDEDARWVIRNLYSDES